VDGWITSAEQGQIDVTTFNATAAQYDETLAEGWRCAPTP